MPAREISDCPIAREGRVCASIATLEQRQWEHAREVDGLASEVREHTATLERHTQETRELRVAVGVTNRLLGEKFDPILAALQTRSVPPPPEHPSGPPTDPDITGMFAIPVQRRIHTARKQRNIGVGVAALVSAAITAVITSNLLPAIADAIVRALGGH